MIGIFKVGDIIKGKENEYGITNDEMMKAVVTEVNRDRMEIKVLEHKRESEINEKYWVDNDDKDFTFYNAEITKQLFLDLPIGSKIITDNEDEYHYFIKIGDKQFSNDDDDLLWLDDDFDSSFDLENKKVNLYGKKYNIIKIEKPIYSIIYMKEQQPKEMTIKEISKILGYDVKIVKEK